MRRALTLVFAVSGASGLIYEVAWMRTLRLLVGSTTLSHTIVLAAFMAGLALGAWAAGKRVDAARRPLRVYAWLEALIGVYGIAFPLLARLIVPPLGALYRAFEESPVAFAVGELFLLGPIVLPGAALMGATLPALGRVVAHGDVAREGGWLYAVNTLGAAAGAALGGFVLLPQLGLAATIGAAVATNLVLAAIAYRLDLHGAPETQATAAAEEKGWPRLAQAAVATSALAGMTLQIAWTKLFVVSVGSSTFAFTGVVAVYILGLGAGAALAVRLLGRAIAAPRLLAAASLGAGVAAALTVPFFAWFPEEVAAIVTGHEKNIPAVLAIEMLFAGVALGPATLLLGTVFPLGVAVAGGSPERSGRALARISVASSLGSIAGAFVGGLILVRVLGLTGALRAGAVIAGAAGIFPLLASDLRRAWALLAVPLLAILLPGPDAKLLDAGAFLYGAKILAKAQKEGTVPRLRREAKLLHHAEGEDLVAAIYTSGTDDLLVINGKIDASSTLDAETQRLVGHLPLFLHGPGAKTVAVVGLGSGMTAGAVLTHPGVERVDLIEISPTVVETVKRSELFMQLSRGALDDHRLRLLIADGRTHLRHASERYDVIVSEPTNPWIAGVGDLYTHEHFQNVKERLAPNGVIAQWLQGYSTTTDLYRTIVRTFTDVFPDAQIWRFFEGEDSLLVARREGATLPLRFSEVRELLASAPALRESLRDAGVDSAETLAWYFALDAAATRELAGDGERNTDDSGWLEHRAPFALFQQADPFDDQHPKALRLQLPFPELPEGDWEKIRAALPDFHLAVRNKTVDDPEALPLAERQLRRALERAPPPATLIHEQLASVLAYRLDAKRFDDDDQVRAALDEIERTDTRSTVVLQRFATGARRLRRSAQAERAYRRLLELRPRSEEARIRLAEILLGKKEAKEALSVLEPVKEETVELLVLRGCALVDVGRGPEAESVLGRATALDPSQVRAWAALGLERTRAGDPGGARAAFEKIAELAPDQASSWFNLAFACYQANDAEAAEKACRRALAIDPGHAGAKELLARLGR